MRATLVAVFVVGSLSTAIADDSSSPKERAEKFFRTLAEKGPGRRSTCCSKAHPSLARNRRQSMP